MFCIPVVLHCIDAPPIAIFLVPVVFANNEDTPSDVLQPPVVLLYMELTPIAVLFKPLVLQYKALLPTPVLFAPVVLEHSELYPNAEFLAPVVLDLKVFKPKLVLQAPVVLLIKAPLPTLVLVVMFPPPKPTHTPWNMESQVVDSEPVTCEFSSAMRPFLATNSFGILLYLSSLSLRWGFEYKYQSIALPDTGIDHSGMDKLRFLSTMDQTWTFVRYSFGLFLLLTGYDYKIWLRISILENYIACLRMNIHRLFY